MSGGFLVYCQEKQILDAFPKIIKKEFKSAHLSCGVIFISTSLILKLKYVHVLMILMLTFLGFSLEGGCERKSNLHRTLERQKTAHVGTDLKISLKEEGRFVTIRLRSEAAGTVAQNFLKSFRKCPENVEFPLHDWRHMLWKKCLGESNSEIAGEIYCQWLNLRYKYIAPSPEVVSLLETLRKSYYLALITNGPSNSQWEKIKRLRLSQYFDLILVSGDLEWEKPNKNIFLEACIHLGVSPSECIMVGDKLETDILGGIESGLGGTVWVPSSENTFSSNASSVVPDYVINDIAELRVVLSSESPSNGFESKKVPFYLRDNYLDLDDGNSNCSDGS